jgi:cell pole-organizing protein PopZ
MPDLDPETPERSMTSATAKSSEPTIDDILASIRRIIADEQQTEAQPAPSAPRVVVAEASDDVLDLAQPLARPAALVSSASIQPAQVPTSEGVVSALRPKTAEVRPASPPPAAAAVAGSSAPSSDSQRLERLITGEAEIALTAAFGRISALKVSAETRTLEGLVADLLRPMLKDWLDANLPAIAERLVKQEIERIATQSGR